MPIVGLTTLAHEFFWSKNNFLNAVKRLTITFVPYLCGTRTGKRWMGYIDYEAKNVTYQKRWPRQEIHRRSIYMPKSCDFSGSSKGSLAAAFSSVVFLPLKWCPGRGPSLEHWFCQTPNFSTAIGGCKIASPEKMERSCHGIVVESEHAVGIKKSRGKV